MTVWQHLISLIYQLWLAPANLNRLGSRIRSRSVITFLFSHLQFTKANYVTGTILSHYRFLSSLSVIILSHYLCDTLTIRLVRLFQAVINNIQDFNKIIGSTSQSCSDLQRG